MRILVVDDDPLAGEMTSALLEAHGYGTLIADNAMDAIEQLEAVSDIALIVSDMYMPLIDGLELLATLREQQLTLPFILLTGDRVETDQATLPAGLTASLSKDADLESTLLLAVNQALDGE